jgi:hypothetical protein
MKKIIVLLLLTILMSCSHNTEKEIIINESEKLKIEEVKYQQELLDFEESLKNITNEKEKERLTIE